ncbi:histidine kinase [Sulfolobales archaeon HS-7]|nr:histidine kinase [Sulfolobales archaeon HS-7]
MPLHKRYMRKIEVKVNELMSAPPVTVALDSSLEDAVRKMIEGNVGSVMVTDSDRRLRGIITEKDVLIAVSKGLLKKEETKVTDIMSRNVIAVTPDDVISEVIEKMRAHNIRHIPVTDYEGRPVGMISIRDILDFTTSYLKVLLLPEEI